MKVRQLWDNTETRQFVFCFVGVILFKALDVVGQEFTIRSLSLGYVAFAVGIALLITVVTDNDPIPPRGKEESKESYDVRKKKIYSRVARTAILWGFAWQTVLSRFEELIDL